MRMTTELQEIVDIVDHIFFFQAEDGIRDLTVTGVQTCALPISGRSPRRGRARARQFSVHEWRRPDRKSTRLNSSHSQISYAVFCLKKKKTTGQPTPPATSTTCRPPTSSRPTRSASTPIARATLP